MAKKITIELFPDGSSKVDSSGFTGSSCQLATRDLELALAGNDPNNSDEKKKPDFFAKTGTAQSQHN